MSEALEWAELGVLVVGGYLAYRLISNTTSAISGPLKSIGVGASGTDVIQAMQKTGQYEGPVLEQSPKDALYQTVRQGNYNVTYRLTAQELDKQSPFVKGLLSQGYSIPTVTNISSITSAPARLVNWLFGFTPI